MKRIRYALLAALVISSAPTAFAQQQPRKVLIAEVKSQTPAARVAPRECLLTFREFFQYVQRNEPDIIHDEKAQKRWLTDALRKALAEHVANSKPPSENPDFPSNRSFIGAWDPPTTYSVAGSRRYGKRAIIDVLYKWGPNTNYAGDERTTSFVFVLEHGAWKLDDIYTFGGKFVTAQSLYQYFREK
jgi:hypothetical protein